jgi:hypothetical protein
MDDKYMQPYRTNSAFQAQAPTEKQLVARQLNRVIGNTAEALASATTVFPFTLFPDTVTVDREKLTVTHRVFFAVGEVVSVRVEDILNVTADVGPFFGSLKINTRFFDESKPYIINYLWRGETLHMKRILQGYMTALKQHIDCSALSTKELATLLDSLSKDDSSHEI